MEGRAIYLDADGSRPIVCGNGSDVLGVRIVVTLYDAVSSLIGLDLTEGTETYSDTKRLCSTKKITLSSKKDSHPYYRRANQVSALLRKSCLRKSFDEAAGDRAHDVQYRRSHRHQ
jgi:hypothetical protein